MANSEVLIDWQTLESYIKRLYEGAGLASDDAANCASCTITTNLWGVDSHGVLRTPAYVERILRKAINPQPRVRFLAAADAPLSLMDGDGGMGYVVGRVAMREAVKKAERFGIGAVVVQNSNHFGAAALYARMAVDDGMLGIATTNVMPNIGMPGAKRPVTGNNPLALAAPLPGKFPFSLDISMSAVAGGKILLARKKGERIPKNWAVDSEGNETDDPALAFGGILLPAGMHKGLGLSLFIDVLTGVLSGGPFLGNIKSMYEQPDDPSETSHFFCAINPAAFHGREAFMARMEGWAKAIKATPMRDPNAHQLVPGELEYLSEIRRRAEGIPVPMELLKDLTALGGRLGLSESLISQPCA